MLERLMPSDLGLVSLPNPEDVGKHRLRVLDIGGPLDVSARLILCVAIDQSVDFEPCVKRHVFQQGGRTREDLEWMKKIEGGVRMTERVLQEYAGDIFTPGSLGIDLIALNEIREYNYFHVQMRFKNGKGVLPAKLTVLMPHDHRPEQHTYVRFKLPTSQYASAYRIPPVAYEPIIEVLPKR